MGCARQYRADRGSHFVLEWVLMATTTVRKRRSTSTSTRSTPRQTGSMSTRRSLPRPPGGIGNIIGVVILVIAAFVAGYLIGRARPAVMAADAGSPPPAAVGEAVAAHLVGE